MTKKIGRPTKFTQELADKICATVATTPRGLRYLCETNDEFPAVDTIRMWRMQNDSFSVQYAKAKLLQADILAEDCVDIADDNRKDEIEDENGNIRFNSEFAARSRIRIDTRKWLASKLLPKQYGDIRILEEKIEENEKLKEELRELREKLDAQYKKEY